MTGIAKAYCTRVGNGPFPTEDFTADGDRLREQGAEFGTTTGRPRRCGWFDAVAAKFACRINGCDQVAIMKLDVLDGFEKIKVCVAYEVDGKEVHTVPADMEKVKPIYREYDGWDKVEGAKTWDQLPEQAQRYIESLEEILGVKIGLVSTSPDRNDTIRR